MKSLWCFIIGFSFLFSCGSNNPAAIIEQAEHQQQDTSKDKQDIQNLIRQTLVWANSTNGIELLPVLKDSNDSIYIGLDINKHKDNIEALRKTGFFAEEFIKNYNQIILTLDRKLRNNEFEQWLVGDLQTFRFANDIDPWCSCQDIPYDEPSPWENVAIEIINLNQNKAELSWKWGRLDLNSDKSVKEFSYKYSVIKEDNKWKIAYLQEFDFENAVKKDGM